MKAKNIIIQNIEMFKFFYTERSTSACNMMHTILGKIQLAVELEILSLEEGEILIDEIFATFYALK